MVANPLPYQGSKRALAARILAAFPARVGVLHEPFAGSAAVSLAALVAGRAERVELADRNEPLMRLWSAIVAEPQALSDRYGVVWRAQHQDPAAHYNAVRDEFNAALGAGAEPADPVLLLYLLARCVKAAVRYNASGEFNQSADRRRSGMRPEVARARIEAAATLLRGRSGIAARDYRESLERVGPGDVVYLDPPYEGVSSGRDTRYVAGVSRAEFVGVLGVLVSRGVAFAVSYDGRHGDRTYGAALPAELGLTRRELDAGPSTSATLLGRRTHTVEALYVSPALVARTS